MRLDFIEPGDARELSAGIQNASVDMVFTDPVYQDMDGYDWLGREAVRILKPDKPMLVWCSSQKIPQVRSVLDQYLSFKLPFFYVVKAKIWFLNAYKAFTWTTPLLVYSKGEYRPRAWCVDTFISTARPAGTHKWNKNGAVIRYYMQRIGFEGDIVWDPFCGSGPVPDACKRLGRRYLASEQDAEVAAVAQARISSVRRDLF